MHRSLLTLILLAGGWAHAASCQSVAENINRQLRPDTNTSELTVILSSLNQQNRLPAKFVTKREAQAAGWRPGSSLWQSLPGKSIGGDRFGNRENRLPRNQYQEADLDYQGGKRGAKRIVFSKNGLRFITVDHYQTFTEVPSCQ
ncbi:ribonuclease domain-containing protein [Janthinobacterium sp. B9-8]|uniref:ribonuclease domain-containing protein n=1 Tax=Janthinobacterium sp. B9-8 TaxID=1236179 RepID=UPI00061D3060|nr:ribonuclease domain-containing protein [Janthinobacterium sp. B9-8]AMC34662.1 ribonuclease [Janthinobacterium sp. B9-8]